MYRRVGVIVGSYYHPILLRNVSETGAYIEGLFEVPDAAAHERFQGAELVTGALGVRSYAGCALRTSTGEALGVLGVYDTTARPLSAAQRGSLLLLAEQAVAGIELRSRLSEFVLLAAAPASTTPAGAASADTASPNTASASCSTARPWPSITRMPPAT